MRLAEANGGLPRSGGVTEADGWSRLIRGATLARMLAALLCGFCYGRISSGPTAARVCGQQCATPLHHVALLRSDSPVLPLDIRNFEIEKVDIMPSPLSFLLTLCVVLVCVWLWWRSNKQ